MRTARLFLLCFVALLFVIGCSSEKKEPTEQPQVETETQATTTTGDIQEITLAVSGMTCGACVSAVQDGIAKVDGVSGVNVSLENNNAVIKVQKGKVTNADLIAAVKGAGFSAEAATN